MTALYFVIASIVLLYVGAPLLIFRSMRLRTNAPWEQISPDDLPQPASDFFGQTAPVLMSAGFEVRTYIKITGMMAGAAQPHYIAVWCHPVRGQMAGQISMSGKNFVEFSTVLADGFTLNTGNQDDLGPLASRGNKNSLRASTQDIEELYRAHCLREQELLKADAARFLPAPGREAEEFIESVRRDLKDQCKVGDMREVEPNVFGPSFTGAFVMTWKQPPPLHPDAQSQMGVRVESPPAAHAERHAPPDLSPHRKQPKPHAKLGPSLLTDARPQAA